MTPSASPFIIGFAGTIAGFCRAFIYRYNVNWKILAWLLPGAVTGSLIGAGLFASLVTKEATGMKSSFPFLKGLVEEKIDE